MRSISVKRSSNGMLTDAIAVSDHALYVTLGSGPSSEVAIPDEASIAVLTKVEGAGTLYMRLGSVQITETPVDGELTDIVPNPYARIVLGSDKLQLFSVSHCRVCLEFYK